MSKRRRGFSQPSVGQVHANEFLSNLSVAYRATIDNLISPNVFPVIPVQHQSDKYRTYDRNDWARDEMQIRPPATESAGSGWRMGEDNYNALVWALHKDLDNQTIANADPDLDLTRDSVNFLTQKAAIRQERAWAAEFFVPGVWGTTTTPTDLWSDYGFSNPIGDIEVAKRVIALAGQRPNTIVAGYDVFTALMMHPDIIDRYKYTQSDVITPQLLARLFGVDNFYVADNVVATNVEGETAVYDFVMGKHLLLTYANPNPSPLTVSAGYRFMWSGISDGLGLDAAVYNFYVPEIKSTRYEIEMAWDDKVVAADLGYFFESAVA